MDIHSAQSAGFTNLPFTNVYFSETLSKELVDRNIQVVVAPDTGALKKAEAYALKHTHELAFIAKRRLGDAEVEVTQFIGDVKHKNVLILDDLTESCGTMIAAAETCKKNGAKSVVCAVTHNCMNPIGHQRLQTARNNNIVDAFYASNTNDAWVSVSGIVDVVDCAKDFANML
jgi:ribose-phosphate pyrophosphokinase